MFLKRLEIHGFKSFAQKTTLEFDKGIIAIVGPNGSGKSNVADCLRWVLGEQSAKLIRGKKSDDVIFAGSEKKGKLGFAEVVATFDNRDHRIPVDAAEVSIGRRIDRSGESEYLINNNKVRLLDIVDLVLRSNIGTSRYTVIGQGTIDQMILAGPSEVKNLLDEASGVKTYYIKREKTLRRLEQTANNLMRAEDLIAEIEPRLKSLRRQAKKMEARGEIEQELKIYQREFFGKTFWSLKISIDAFVDQITGLEENKSTLEQLLLENRKSVENFENKNIEQLGEFKKIQESMDSLQTQKNKLLEDLSLVRGKMQSQKTAVKGDAKTLQVEVHNIAKKILEVREKITQGEKEKQQTSEKLSAQTKILDQINSQLKALYTKLEQPSSFSWSSLEKDFTEIENLANSFYSRLEQGAPWVEVRPVAEQLRQSLANFKNAAKNSQSTEIGGQSLQMQLQQLSKEKENISSALQTMDLELSKSKITLEFLQKELGGLEQEKLHLDLELKKASTESPDDFWKDLITEEERIKKEVDALLHEITKLEQLFKTKNEKEGDRQKTLRDMEEAYRNHQDQLSKIKDQISVLSIEKAKVDTQMEVLVEEIGRMLGSEIFANIKEQKVESHTPDLEAKIIKLKNQLDMVGGIDELTMKEYQETEARYTNLSTQVEDLKNGMADLRNIMEELDEHIKTKFNQAFHKINEKFEHYFRILFNGGRAYLSILKAEDKKVEDQLNEEEAGDAEPQEQLRPEEKIVQKYEKGASNIMGIDIKATPPNKKLSSIQALSGGERALTSIALLCSLLTCFPSPFVVLDEVDAALDDANTIRFGQILASLAHQTQFITITHNRETMAQAGMLYGVTMGDDGISKLLSVKLDQAKEFAK